LSIRKGEIELTSVFNPSSNSPLSIAILDLFAPAPSFEFALDPEPPGPVLLPPPPVPAAANLFFSAFF